MPAAARKTDKVLQPGPHCHTPTHPVGSSTAPIPHPATPLEIVSGTIPKVIIEGQEAAVVDSISDPCELTTCVPAGPGVINMGSATVLHGGKPAARVGDTSNHATCVAPIPAPTGQILPPGATTVIIGG